MKYIFILCAFKILDVDIFLYIVENYRHPNLERRAYRLGGEGCEPGSRAPVFLKLEEIYLKVKKIEIIFFMYILY
jgi:hypothetical protein